MKKLPIILILSLLAGIYACNEAPEEEKIGTKITSFYPTKGAVLDTIEIFGENFKPYNTNVVFFGDDKAVATVVEWDKTRLRAVIPDSGAITGPIKVRVGVHEWTSSTQIFEVDKSQPIITRMSPSSALQGDEVTITGANFEPAGTPSQPNNIVMLGDVQAEIKVKNDSIYEREHKIVFTIPETLPDGKIDVTVTCRGVTSKPFEFMIGTVFTDYFTRKDTEWADKETSGHPLGSEWAIMKGSFRILNNELTGKSGGFALYQAEGSGISTKDEHSFTVAADIRLSQAHPHVYGGIIVNAIDPQNYYVFRISTSGVIQFLRNLDAPGFNLLYHEDNVTAITDATAQTYFRLQVASEIDGEFKLSISNAKTKQVVWEKTVYDNDAEGRYNAGFAGVYDGGADQTFIDNFYISIR